MFWWKLDILLVATTALFSWLFQQRRPKNGTKSTNNWKTYLPPDLFEYFFWVFRDIFPSRRKMPSKQSRFICWRHVVFGSSKGAFWQAAGGNWPKVGRERFGWFFSFWQKQVFAFFFGIDGCLQLSFFFKFFCLNQKTCDFSRFLLIIHWWRTFYEAILKQIWGYGLYGNLQARGFLGEAFWGFFGREGVKKLY